jgi:hypothetical protein
VMSATVNRSLATNSLPCKLLFNLRRNGAPGADLRQQARVAILNLQDRLEPYCANLSRRCGSVRQQRRGL